MGSDTSARSFGARPPGPRSAPDPGQRDRCPQAWTQPHPPAATPTSRRTPKPRPPRAYCFVFPTVDSDDLFFPVQHRNLTSHCVPSVPRLGSFYPFQATKNFGILTRMQSFRSPGLQNGGNERGLPLGLTQSLVQHEQGRPTAEKKPHLSTSHEISREIWSP